MQQLVKSEKDSFSQLIDIVERDSATISSSYEFYKQGLLRQVKKSQPPNSPRTIYLFGAVEALGHLADGIGVEIQSIKDSLPQDYQEAWEKLSMLE
jgi:hypothetical protein